MTNPDDLVGAKIRFLHEITTPPTGDCPSFLLARANDHGKIQEYDTFYEAYPYKVISDTNGDKPWRAAREDFEVIDDQT